MKVVNPNDVSHSIDLIPRFYSALVTFELYNETTREVSTVINSVNTVDGILNISFDFDFTEGQKFQIKMYDDNGVIYRGKLIATTQNPQQYKLTKGLYFYG